MHASFESEFPVSARSYHALGTAAHRRLVHVRWPLWSTKRGTNHAAPAPPTARRERCHNGAHAR